MQFNWKRVGADDKPGLHALIIGISHYPHLPAVGQQGVEHQFGLTNIDGPALAAWRLKEALFNPPPDATWLQPLKSLRLLVSPSAADVEREPGLASLEGAAPTVDEVGSAAAAWRDDCQESDEEVALLCFIGHGLLYEEECLACTDFGKLGRPGSLTLHGSFRLGSLFAGMAGPRGAGYAIARHQFWFVDACRIKVGAGKIGEPAELLTPREEDGTVMERAGLLGTTAGGPSHLLPESGSTAFTEALIKALTAAVAEGTDWPPEAPEGRCWPVTIDSIRLACTNTLLRNPTTRGQTPMPYGSGGHKPLLLHRSPPSFPARVLIRPPCRASEISRWSLTRVEGQPPPDLDENGFPSDPRDLPELYAGHYQVVFNIGAQTVRRVWFASLGNDILPLWWRA